jgi:DNA-binding beta-propeller fold protein YncE
MLTHQRVLVDNLSPGNGWVGLAVSPDGVLLATTHPANSAISVYDTATGTEVCTFGGKGTTPGKYFGPCRLCFTPDNTLLITDHGNHRLQETTSSGDSVRVLPVKCEVFSVAANATHIVAGKRDEEETDDRIMVMNRASGEMERQFAKFGSGDGQVGACMGVSITPDGVIIVAELSAGRASLFSMEGTFLSTIVLSGSKIVDVAALANNNCLLADYASHQLVAVSRGAEPRAPLFIPLGDVVPIGIACFLDTVYVLDVYGSMHVFA